MKTRAVIGDIIEISTPKGLAYAQYTYRDAVYGELLKVFHGLHENRRSTFSTIPGEKEAFWAFYPLNEALKHNLVQVVAHEKIPGPKFPLFRIAGARTRTGLVQSWWLWDGAEKWPVEQLNPEHHELPVASVWNHKLLINRIIGAWRSSDER